MVPKWNARESGAAVPISLTGPSFIKCAKSNAVFLSFSTRFIRQMKSWSWTYSASLTQPSQIQMEEESRIVERKIRFIMVAQSQL